MALRAFFLFFIFTKNDGRVDYRHENFNYFYTWLDNACTWNTITCDRVTNDERQFIETYSFVHDSLPHSLSLSLAVCLLHPYLGCSGSIFGICKCNTVFAVQRVTSTQSDAQIQHSLTHSHRMFSTCTWYVGTSQAFQFVENLRNLINSIQPKFNVQTDLYPILSSLSVRCSAWMATMTTLQWSMWLGWICSIQAPTSISSILLQRYRHNDEYRWFVSYGTNRNTWFIDTSVILFSYSACRLNLENNDTNKHHHPTSVPLHPPCPSHRKSLWCVCICDVVRLKRFSKTHKHLMHSIVRRTTLPCEWISDVIWCVGCWILN